MSQSTLAIGDGSGASVRAAINAALQALASNNEGTSEPPTAYAGMWWADTTNGLLKWRNSANTAWITIGKLDAANFGLLPLSGGNMSGTINEVLAPAVASAASPDIWSGAGNALHITGTTSVTGFAAAPQPGARRTLVFDGGLTLTNGSNLILPTGANITTRAGDSCVVLAETTTKFRIVSYLRADGGALAGNFRSQGPTSVSTTSTLPSSAIGQLVQITAAVAVTLPAADQYGVIAFQNISSGTATLVASVMNINGAAWTNYTLSAGQTALFMGDGTSWNCIAISGFGIGLSEVDVSANRAIGGVYTNNTGQVIEVTVSLNYTATTGSWTAASDGVVKATGLGNAAYKTTETVTFTVRSGAQYYVAGTNVSIRNWVEKRKV